MTGVLIVRWQRSPVAAVMLPDGQPTGETDSMPATANSRCAPRRWHHELTQLS
jgi:hypothetical protein